MMKLSVIGCGYLGAVHAACMAELGHEVVGLEVDPRKVALLRSGRAPFHEPGFDDLLVHALATGRLTFTTDPAAVAGAQVHFICVGTPQQDGRYAADLTYVDAAVEALLPHLGPPDDNAALIWNPEFLREGFAIQDTLSPDRIVYGLQTDGEGMPTPAGEVARAVLDEVYDDQLVRQGIPQVVTDLATAQLVKVAANSFLATKISFINAMAELCEATGADVTQLATAIGHDERIGHRFLRAGIGFGGGCLPKDIRAFMARAGELGVDQALTFLREVDGINLRRREHVVELARTACGGRFDGARVAVLGAAFKPDSDDVRDSPALDIASRIAGLGAHVTVTDPAALANVGRSRPDLRLADSAMDAAAGADPVLLLTEWREFVELDPETLGGVVHRRVIIDGRNVLDPRAWRRSGWAYHGLGRPSGRAHSGRR